MSEINISFNANESPEKFFEFFKELEKAGAIEEVEYKTEPNKNYIVEFFPNTMPHYEKAVACLFKCSDGHGSIITRLPAFISINADELAARTTGYIVPHERIIFVEFSVRVKGLRSEDYMYHTAIMKLKAYFATEEEE